jgi:hypothetical protein
MNDQHARGLNAYMNSFDDCGGPVASEMHAAKAERDDLDALDAYNTCVYKLREYGALLYEARDFINAYASAVDERDLLARIDAKLAEGAGDGE